MACTVRISATVRTLVRDVTEGLVNVCPAVLMAGLVMTVIHVRTPLFIQGEYTLSLSIFYIYIYYKLSDCLSVCGCADL